MLKKNQKQSIVSLYSESLNSSPSFILINFAGTKVSEFEKLRNAFRNLDTKISVVKNTLLQKATLNTDFEQYFNELKGETAIAQFLSVINQPAVKFLYAAKSIPSSLVNVLNNLKDKK